jgi:hypothetical protein
MIGGAPLIPISQKLNAKQHKEYAAAMARPGDPVTTKPYPVACVTEEGGKWTVPYAVKFCDGTIYDTRTHTWRAARPEPVDPVLDWDNVCAGEPLASNKMVLAGNRMVDEIRKLRAKLLDLEQECRENSLVRIIDEDDERDF